MEHEVNKNFIITRHLNSYCLLCDDCFKADEEVIRQHIQCDPHKNAFQSKTYLENYKDDGIQQFKRGYYCEMCDVLLATKKKISLHVLESTHIDSKVMHSLKQVENGVLVFNCLFIEDDAWHGIVDSTCVICNIDITDTSAHKKEPSHIFIMIQIKLEFQESNIFRKIGNGFVNCLVCNDILSSDIFPKHLMSESHLTKHVKCKENYVSVIERNTEDTNCKNDRDTDENVTRDVRAKYDLKEDNEKSLIIMEESYLDKNKTNNSKGDQSKEEKSNDKKPKNVSIHNTNDIKKAVNKKAINNLSETERNESGTKCNEANYSTSDEFKVCEPHEAIFLAQKLARENKLKYKHGKNSAFCTVCNITISSSIKRMKEHVAEEKHKENFVAKDLLADKIPFVQFISSFIEVTVRTSVFVILNKSFCITKTKFLFITRNEYTDTERCQLCNTSDNLYPLDRHEETLQHGYLSAKTQVLCSIQSEFIREILNKNLFHCGFCNLVANREELLQHLKSTSHKVTKMKAALTLSAIMKHI